MEPLPMMGRMSQGFAQGRGILSHPSWKYPLFPSRSLSVKRRCRRAFGGRCVGRKVWGQIQSLSSSLHIILFVSCLPVFRLQMLPQNERTSGITRDIMGTVLWCTSPLENGVLDANVCDLGCKRLRGRLQTFAGRVANVCV